MSTVAKILIVVNFLLACAFVGSAANYLGQKDWMQQKLEDEKGQETTKFEGANKRANELFDANKTYGQENQVLATKATDATARAQAAEAQSQVLGDQLRRISEQHSVAVKALELLNSTLVDNQKTIGGLQDANLKLTTQVQVEQTARIAAENMQASLQRQLDDETAAHKASEGSLADASRHNQEQQAVIEAYRSKFPGADPGLVQPSTPPGKVLAADNGMGLVVISLGQEDGVQKGFEYIVSRGSTYVATIKITDVQAKKATGMSVKGMQKSPIATNDTVITR